MTMDMKVMVTAAQDPTHPQHHFAWGQLLGTALVGLAGFEGGPAVYANQKFLSQFISGILGVFTQKPADTQTAPEVSAP